MSKSNIFKVYLSNVQQDSSRGPKRVILGLEDLVTKATFHQSEQIATGRCESSTTGFHHSKFPSMYTFFKNAAETLVLFFSVHYAFLE